MVAKDFGHENREGYFLPIIQRNSTIPVSRVERVVTVSPNQTRLQVEDLPGRGPARGGQPVSRRVRGERHPARPGGPANRHPFHLRPQWRTGGGGHHRRNERRWSANVVTRHARGPVAPADRRQRSSRWRSSRRTRATRPSNRLLLRRAERIYQELSLEGRGHAGTAPGWVSRRLWRCKTTRPIDRHRSALQEFLDRVDRSDIPPENDHDDWYRPLTWAPSLAARRRSFLGVDPYVSPRGGPPCVLPEVARG